MLEQYSVPHQFGRIERVVVANPAAATQWAYLLPNGKRYQLLSCKYEFDTDANVGNRTMGLIALDDTHLVWASYLVNQIPANQLFFPCFAVGMNGPQAVNIQAIYAPIPYPYTMPGNWQIQSNVSGMQIGDQISGIELIFATWIEQTV